jgi:UPF0271 protein
VKEVLDQVEKIKADTWCIHGDGPHALEFAKALKAKVLKAKALKAKQ